jgi:hypothetical protein
MKINALNADAKYKDKIAKFIFRIIKRIDNINSILIT